MDTKDDCQNINRQQSNEATDLRKRINELIDKINVYKERVISLEKRLDSAKIAGNYQPDKNDGDSETLKKLKEEIEKRDILISSLKTKLQQETNQCKETEKALHENKERLCTQYKCMPIPTFTWQRKEDDFILIDFNDAGLRNTNGMISQYLGAKASTLFYDRPEIIEDMKKCYTEKNIVYREMFYQFVSVNKSGYFATTYAFIPPDLILVHTQDITESKRYEKELKESEERFRQVVEFSPFPISILDLNGNYLYVNKSFTNTFGYTQKEIKNQTNWFALTFPDKKSREEAIKLWRADIEQGTSIINPRLFKIKCKNGLFREIYIRPVKIPSDKLFIIYEDITERKMAEEALREDEQRLTAINSLITDYMTIIDEDYTIVSANDAQRRLFGENIIGRKCYSAYFKHDEVCDPCVVKKTFEDRENHDAEIEVCGVDGKKRYFHSTTSIAARYEDGRPRLVVEISRDITEHKQAIKALQEKEERYRNLFNGVPIGLFITTPQGKVVDVNQTLQHILAYPSKELMLATNALEAYANPDDRKHLLSLLDHNKIVLNYETRLKRYDGTILWCTMNTKAIYNSEGKIQYYEGAIVDITERKLAEQRQTRLETQLRQAKKIEALGTLAGGIAHEFNNILSFILGYSELTLSELPTGSQLYNNLEEILNACNRATDIIGQILIFSRQAEQEQRPVEIASIVKEALKLIRASVPSTIEIHEKIDNIVGIILADPTQIHQVVVNLCTNAYQAMRAKCGTMEVKLEVVNINSSSENELQELKKGKYALITVTDTGHGIDKTSLERIFDPFFTTKMPGEGTGMGLSIVHGIVKSHNGEITVNSTAGKGTTLKVYFPLLQQIVPSLELKNDVPPEGTENILFVDDEEHLTFIISEALGRLGYKVTALNNSMEAYEIFKKNPREFDIVITDLTLPQMTGDRLAAEILRIRPDIPIILITGFSEIITPERAEKIGIREYIMKPILAINLAKTIRCILDKEGDNTRT